MVTFMGVLEKFERSGSLPLHMLRKVSWRVVFAWRLDVHLR
jgi:hypothetical protein